MQGALRRRLRRPGWLLVLIVAGAAAQEAAAPAWTPPAPPDLSGQAPVAVTEVVAGNQLVVQRDGAATPVRLLGVYVPPAAAAAAHDFAAHLLLGERVWLVAEPGWPDRDDDGRSWLHVYRAPDGLYVNLELVRQGYARLAAAAPFVHQDAFRAGEQVARRARKGLWSARAQQADPAASQPVDDAAPAAAAPPQPAAPPPAGVAASQPAAGADPVYITEHGRKYHRAACQHARRGARPVPLSEARALGLTPCARCQPP